MSPSHTAPSDLPLAPYGAPGRQIRKEVFLMENPVLTGKAAENDHTRGCSLSFSPLKLPTNPFRLKCPFGVPAASAG